MTHKFNLLFVAGIFLFLSMACSFSTANLSELKFGKDKDASGAGTTFNPTDEIFAVTAVNNASGQNKVKFRLLFDKVEGGQSGAVAYKVEKETTVEGSRAIWLNFSVPGGFVPGSYKFETVLMGEDGKELDRKTGSFTITGTASNKPASTDNKSSDDTKSNSTKDEDKDSEDK